MAEEQNIEPEDTDEPVQKDGLTIKQRLFVDALAGPAQGNATKAAEMAGYSASNRVVLASVAWETLRYPQVIQALAHALAKKKMGPEWAKTQLADLAQADMSNFLTVEEDGTARLDFAMAAQRGALGQIRKYQEDEYTTTDKDERVTKVVKRKIEIHDRMPAVALALRVEGILKENEQSEVAQLAETVKMAVSSMMSMAMRQDDGDKQE